MTEYPREFGGILSGIRFDDIWIIVDFQEPQKFHNSLSGFTRDSPSLNVYLQEVFNSSKGQIEYLGEWHSHPNNSTQYSENDAKSMIEIAEDVNITIETPLLLIIGNSKKSFKYSLYQCVNRELIEYKQTKI